jgi:phenol 2-monooxygenase
VQFHDKGYVIGDPRVQPASGSGIDRPEDIPDEVDVLIVGAGPAGMIAAAQLSQFPDITTRIVERRSGPLLVGQADGIGPRSVETFNAFGFAERIVAEAYRTTETVFWKPDPSDPSRIVRDPQPVPSTPHISEFPRLAVNQARVVAYFAEFMANAPTRMAPDYGLEFQTLEIAESGEYPVTVVLKRVSGEEEGTERRIRAKYVVGADGARSKVRDSIGRKFVGVQANQAWGVVDMLAVTEFPDVRTKCVIQSGSQGSILLIPREGGYLFRLYVDLGEVLPGTKQAIRATTLDEIIDKANRILHPFTLDVRDVPWHSVYEVGHRLTDRFDDLPVESQGSRTPRVFIVGDACHTHSAQAGQGMNVSMQDGFNLAWKLAYVLQNRSSKSLLATYSAERLVVAQELIDFDREWARLMATSLEDLEHPAELDEFYLRTEEFPTGFLTRYTPSVLTAEATHQDLATGFPVGKRFRSAIVERVCDANVVHLGHHAKADGRWRIYIFADKPAAGQPSATTDLAEWLSSSPDSPIVAHTPVGADIDAWFDLKVIYQQDHNGVDFRDVPDAFKPITGPFSLIDYEKVYAVSPEDDIFEARGLDRAGVIVVVRPDQYVANVLPLTARDELAAFFKPLMNAR